MGVQNTALRPVDGLRLGVTFTNGTLVSLGLGVGRALLGHSPALSWSPHALLWCAFASGAAMGTSLYLAFGFLAVSGPAARVAATAMLVSIVLFFKRRTRTHTVSNNPT